MDRFRDELLSAAACGDCVEVASLLAAGADPDSKIDDDDCALAQAAWHGHLEIARLLVAAGANLEAKDSNGVTPLMYAAQEAHTFVVAFLLESGAKVDARNNQLETALLFARRSENSLITAETLKSFNDPAYRADATTVAKLAALDEALPEVVRLLLAAGADVNVTDVYGYTPLINFTMNGHVEIVRLLLEAGADVQAETVDGDTALTEA
jgi:ankyrin repeat protein